MLLIGIFNTLRKVFIILLSFAFSSFAPIIVAVFGNVQDLAHAKKRKQVAMFLDKLEFYGWGCAKMLTASDRISLFDENSYIRHFLLVGRCTCQRFLLQKFLTSRTDLSRGTSRSGKAPQAASVFSVLAHR